MTEQEWLTSTHPKALLRFLNGKASDRKLRLFACACSMAGDAIEPFLQQSIQLAERYADGQVGDDGLKSLAVAGSHSQLADLFSLWVVDKDIMESSVLVAGYLARSLQDAAIAHLHDIFGNPFRPVTIDPAWLSSDVRLLAAGIYEEKAFDRLPILADALQDAGCENEEVLSHCRTEGPHVRGCWVVDLLLGKS